MTKHRLVAAVPSSRLVMGRVLSSTIGRISAPDVAVPVVLLAAFVVRGAWLDEPPGGLIFDEAYYVNAARVILGIPVAEGAAYFDAQPGLDPNVEHPPLGKLAMAASMRILGDNGLGWRIPSVIAGMVALGALYLLVRAAGATAGVAILSLVLVAFDNLMIVHSRIGTLDMMALAAALVGAWLWLRNRWLLAGVALAVGVLFKLTALYAVLAAGVWLVGQLALARADRARAMSVIGRGARLSLAFVLVAGLGLWVLDLAFTRFTSPVDHVQHMVSYGTGLRAGANQGPPCSGATSSPLQWPFNTCQITYLRVDVTTSAGDEVVGTSSSIDVRAALNPLLAAAIPFAALFAAWHAWRNRDRSAAWAVGWGLANWVPYVLLVAVADRVMYFYYFLPVVPAIGVGTALLLLRAGLPRIVPAGYLAAYLAGFIAYFPFRQIP